LILVAGAWFLVAGHWLTIGGSYHLILDENLNNLTFFIEYRKSTIKYLLVKRSEASNQLPETRSCLTDDVR